MTHIGRAACVVVMLFMPIIIAFITASTTKKISLTPDEATLMVNIDSNHLRVRVLVAAASMLQLWWRQVCVCVERDRARSRERVG